MLNEVKRYAEQQPQLFQSTDIDYQDERLICPECGNEDQFYVEALYCKEHESFEDMIWCDACDAIVDTIEKE